MPEPRTSKPEYGPYLLEALLGLGEATRDKLLEKTYTLMVGRLHPMDLETLPGGVPRWMRQAENMLDGLVEEGYVEERGGTLRATGKAVEYLRG